MGLAAGSNPTAQQAAEEYLRAGGDALGAVVCGFFAAAGESPGVLLGSLGLLLTQVGGGARAFDGRLRQPGIGARRARGFAIDDAVPAPARVAAPSSIAALLVALRYGRSAPLHKILAAGVASARLAGCERRADVLEQIQRLGASALAAPGLARALLHVASPSEGGSLAMADLEAVPAVDHPARVDGVFRRPPWADEPESKGSGADWIELEARQQGLCARDTSGGLVALCYDEVSAGVAVDELELVLPLAAVPPRRGQPRVAPGRFLPAPTPLSIEVSPGDVPLRVTIQLAGRAPLSVLAESTR